MSQLKTRPLSIRIDQNLYDSLANKAQENNQTLNSLVREFLYLKMGLDANGLNEYEELNLVIKNTSAEIQNNLSSITFLVSDVLKSLKIIDNNSGKIKESENIANKMVLSIERSQDTVARYQKMMIDSYSSFQKEQKYVIDSITKEKMELLEDLSLFKEEVRSLVSFEKKISMKTQKRLLLINASLFCVSIGLLLGSVFL